MSEHAPAGQELASSRPLLEKLGVKPGMKVLLAGAGYADFEEQLESAGADVRQTENATDFDLIFFRVAGRDELARLLELRQLLKANGAIWLLRRKGPRRVLDERETMAAGKTAGLVDVKVVNFSPDESAEKFVIPLADR